MKFGTEDYEHKMPSMYTVSLWRQCRPFLYASRLSNHHVSNCLGLLHASFKCPPSHMIDISIQYPFLYGCRMFLFVFQYNINNKFLNNHPLLNLNTCMLMSNNLMTVLPLLLLLQMESLVGMCLTHQCRCNSGDSQLYFFF